MIGNVRGLRSADCVWAIAGDRFFAHRRRATPRRGHLDADLFGPGQQHLVRRDLNVVEAGALRNGRASTRRARDRARSRPCAAWRSDAVRVADANRRRQARGSAARHSRVRRLLPTRVKPKEPARAPLARPRSASARRRDALTRHADAPRACHLFRSLRISGGLARAFWPDPPVMPPPGCVPAPHR